jgi:hypothetical protein
VTALLLIASLLAPAAAAPAGPAAAAPAAAESAAAAPAAAAPAAAPCTTFTRASAAPPPPVHEWLAHSADERVVMCAQPATAGNETALYFGEGGVTRHGTVCSYNTHGLTLRGSGAASRLQRYERGEALAMAMAGADCPLPHGADGPAYVDTYDVSQAAFISIMQLWSATTSGESQRECCSARGARQPAAAPPPVGAQPPASAPPAAAGAAAIADSLFPGAGVDAGIRQRLRTTIGADRMSTLTLTRVVRVPGSLLHRRYALFVRAPVAPGTAPSLYVIYLDKALRGPLAVTGFAETN